VSDESTGRDRLRELLDAVLAEDHRNLAEMAGSAYASPFHFSRRLTRDAGEPPVAMRRRVMLERAAWQLQHGTSVTDAAFAAGYESVEGFGRAFRRHYGHAPSAVPAGTDTAASGGVRGYWLPAPNGIHFHPPVALWVQEHDASAAGRPPGGAGPRAGDLGDVTWLLVRHDVDDTRALLEAAAALPDERYRACRLPGTRVVVFGGPEESAADLLEALVHTKETWVASITGADTPVAPATAPDAAALADRHERAAAAWLAVLRDVDRRGAWTDRVVDALCDPPESFTLGGILAHVLTFSAARRHLVRTLLGEDGAWSAATPESPAATGDPLNWLRSGLT
jgi:AraC family transcriptional regulator